MNEFGQTLRNLREKAGFNLKKLADALGWSVVYLSDIERGRRNPPTTTKIADMVKIMNLDLDDYFELIDTACIQKDRVELELTSKSKEVTETALILARSWDGLTDQEAKKIQEILSNRE